MTTIRFEKSALARALADFDGWKAEKVEEFYKFCRSTSPSQNPPSKIPFPSSDSCILFTPLELETITNSLGYDRLDYWVKVLTSYAEQFPAKFKKYQSHKAVIENWERKELSSGKLWCQNHPGGPGYYPSWQLERLGLLVSEPNSTNQMGLFPK